MTMHKERAADLGGEFGQFDHAIRRHAVVTVGQMDVAQSVFARGFHIRLAAVHADNGLHSQFRERGESLVAFGPGIVE